VITTLETAAEALATSLASGYGLVLGNAGRLAGTSPVALNYYSNHQMPRGRRRTTLSRSGTSFKVTDVPGLLPLPVVPD
jgi:hypothetical protein